MRYLSDSDVTQMMGIGYLGEVRQGPDGNLYQYVQGVDGLGNPIGSWWKRLARRALPWVQRLAPFVPGVGPAVAAGLKVATPFLRQAGVAGNEGIGALYEAPDGSLYQVQGLAADEDLQGIGEDATTQMMGIGYLGEVRQGPDGNLYQWRQGVDGLGNPVGSWWSVAKRFAKRYARYIPAVAAVRAAAPFLRQALPIAQQVASVIPGGEAALTAAAPILKEAGVAGSGGLGALYQAPDGTLYQQVQGLDDDAELQGLEADDELQGIDDDPELHGFDEGEELRGLHDDVDLSADNEDLRGFEADQEMQGVEGYVRQDGVNGLEAYVPQEPPQTRWYTGSAPFPEVWKPLW